MNTVQPNALSPGQLPLLAPRLIGRAEPLRVIHEALEAARSRASRVLVLAGEAGIGKTRLIREATHTAASLGYLPLQGRCFASDQAIPYAPLIDLLRAYLAHYVAEPASELRSVLVSLAELLPELGVPRAEAPAAAPSDPQQEQRRLYQALYDFLARLEAPLLLVVEDLHWSDEGSLGFLRFLARRADALPICVIVTYRTDETSAPLTELLVTLQREQLSSELALPRLSEAEAAKLIQDIFTLPQPARPEFTAALYELTDGNPFFIEESLKTLVTAGEIFHTGQGWDRRPLDELHIPRSVLLAVQQRLGRLSAEAREALTIAAVAGRRFDFALLQELTGHTEPKLVALMKELIQAQLVVEETADSFAFRHALTRQAVEATLLARERRALHQRIADALERSLAAPSDGRLADLAYHFAAAERWEQTLVYAPRAGEQARARYAPRAAVEQYTRAIDAATRLGRAPAKELVRARAQMYELLGAFELARADYLAVLNTAADDRERWQALLDLGWHWTGHDYQQARAYLQAALQLARATGEPNLLAETLNRLGNWYANDEQPGEARQCHEEALTLFTQLGDRRGQAATLDLIGTGSLMVGDIPASADAYAEAILLFRALDERQGLVTALAMRSMRGASYMFDTVHCPAADPAACVREGDEAIQLANQMGWRAGEAAALVYIALGAGARGAYGRALAAGQRCHQLAEEIGHEQWCLVARWVLGAIALDLLDLVEARLHLEPALAQARAIGHAFSAQVATSFLATTLIREGDLAGAVALLADVPPPGAPTPTLPARMLRRAQAELALARKRPADALLMVDDLIASAGSNAQGSAIPGLWGLRAEALAALERPQEALATLEAAVATAESQGTRALLWRLHVARARLLLRLRRSVDVVAAVAAAEGVLADLASELPEPDDALFRQRAQALLPRLRSRTPRQTAKRAFDGLTEREREVAALITLGWTNRQIAEALVLSQRTVQVHITNILGKLGFSSRAQIAAWSVEKGLTHKT